MRETIKYYFGKIEKLQNGKNERKGTRMVKDGEDSHGLQTTNLKNLGEIFQVAKTVT